ncbi:MAG: LysR family transcriptional regulator [Burkholderiales bacterium]|nr:LysR family transcriptional regulator [Burkholderiales bacterium]MDE2277938.1 LysR family transcriptional regulator [Burkholderiales bacterium]
MLNLNRLDLVSLRLFVAVVDAGSLTAGAERFGISLAAASKRIAELEHHCGLALLQRSPRGVTATAGGQALHRHAIDLVAQLERLALAINDFQQGTGGHLRLAANPSALGGFLPAQLALYAARYPAVHIDLEDMLSEDTVRAVASGSAELGVIGENTPCEGLESFVCEVDELVLLLPAGHALAAGGGTPVPFVRALDHDFICLQRQASLTRKISGAAEAVGRVLRLRIQVRSFDVMARMVGAGLGLAILPRSGAATYAGALGLQMAPLAGLDVRRRLLLAMRRRAALTPAALALVEMLQARVNAAPP